MKTPQDLATEQVSETLNSFRDDPLSGAEATADGLVRVRLDGRMQVSGVTIHCDDLPPALRARLETAIVEAARAAQESLVTQMSEALSRQLSR